MNFYFYRIISGWFVVLERRGTFMVALAVRLAMPKNTGSLKPSGVPYECLFACEADLGCYKPRTLAQRVMRVQSDDVSLSLNRGKARILPPAVQIPALVLLFPFPLPACRTPTKDRILLLFRFLDTL